MSTEPPSSWRSKGTYTLVVPWYHSRFLSALLGFLASFLVYDGMLALLAQYNLASKAVTELIPTFLSPTAVPVAIVLIGAGVLSFLASCYTSHKRSKKTGKPWYKGGGIPFALSILLLPATLAGLYILSQFALIVGIFILGGFTAWNMYRVLVEDVTKPRTYFLDKNNCLYDNGTSKEIIGYSQDTQEYATLQKEKRQPKPQEQLVAEASAKSPAESKDKPDRKEERKETEPSSKAELSKQDTLQLPSWDSMQPPMDPAKSFEEGYKTSLEWVNTLREAKAFSYIGDLNDDYQYAQSLLRNPHKDKPDVLRGHQAAAFLNIAEKTKYEPFLSRAGKLFRAAFQSELLKNEIHLVIQNQKNWQPVYMLQIAASTNDLTLVQQAWGYQKQRQNITSLDADEVALVSPLTTNTNISEFLRSISIARPDEKSTPPPLSMPSGQPASPMSSAAQVTQGLATNGEQTSDTSPALQAASRAAKRSEIKSAIESQSLTKRGRVDSELSVQNEAELESNMLDWAITLKDLDSVKRIIEELGIIPTNREVNRASAFAKQDPTDPIYCYLKAKKTELGAAAYSSAQAAVHRGSFAKVDRGPEDSQAENSQSDIEEDDTTHKPEG